MSKESAEVPRCCAPTMGLKHQAIHAMLANPDVAPLEEPLECQDWILIDHLMVIHKVKESDYVENGPGAQKPSVREIRSARVTAPHIEFCKRHLGEIEYAARSFSANVDMKEKLFLVTVPGLQGARGGPLATRRAGPSRGSRGEFSDLDPSYCDGEIHRPRGLSGLFVSTFAEPTSERLATLREACRGRGGSKADTLLVELANALEGAVTVCTGDSDLVAVLTASRREGLILRRDNRS
ncbi:hypothetical protein Q5P01_010501 [Channa striata]|uniref:Uncharacterized protein n=1 Tax=Channa striata TaxID=64152 RepID=A0AA88MYR8_CHASR|nr:hypothetical protein Q5P01_010501 [Channa striata]